MRIVKIDRGSIEVEIEGYVLKALGEALLPKQPPEISEYILYRNSWNWLNNKAHPKMEEEELFAFLEKEFFKRNLLLIFE